MTPGIIGSLPTYCNLDWYAVVASAVDASMAPRRGRHKGVFYGMAHEQTQCTVKSTDLTQALEAYRDGTATVHLGVRRLQKQAPSDIQDVVTLSRYDAYRLGEYLVGSRPRHASSDPESTHVIPKRDDGTVLLVHAINLVLPSGNGHKELEAGRAVLEPSKAPQPLPDTGESAVTVRLSRQVWEEWLQYTAKQTTDPSFLSRIVEDALQREMHGDRELSAEVRDAVERLRHVLAHEIQSEAEEHEQ